MVSVYLIGGQGGEAPFGRAFFNTTLGDLVNGDAKEGHKVTLFLVDGGSLDICSIEQLSDAYAALRAYTRGADACETALQLIPYGAIYRIEIGPALGGEEGRVGFRASKPTRVMRSKK